MKNVLKFILFASIIATIDFVFLMSYAKGFARDAEAMLVTIVFISMFTAFDKYVLKDIDTIQEIKKGNVAYALMLIAIAIVFIAGAIVVG